MIIPAAVTLSSLYSRTIALGPPLANHLWQSSLFAAVVLLLTQMLRENRAQVRYRLWLLASVKFLLPFSLLTAAGGYLRWWQPAGLPPPVFSAMEIVTVPFAASAPVHAVVPSSPLIFGLFTRGQMLADLLTVAWIGGSVIVLLLWWIKWRRLTAGMVSNENQPVRCGREIEGLRRLERAVGIRQPIGLVVSASSAEPGIMGIFRPVLLLPKGISGRLTDAQMESIIIHELCHVRRRDNLAAAFHMIVEAIFWFHPLVWWIGTRLVGERERACDEEVLRIGSEPQIYAEGILKVCEFCLESPLECVAGVTGSNLKRRMEEIMIHRIARNLSFGKKLLFIALAAAAILGPVVFGLIHPAQSQAASLIEDTGRAVAGIKSATIIPNKTGEAMPPFRIVSNPPGKGVGFKFNGDEFLATNATLPMLIRRVYGVLDAQITGGPEWMNSERFDVVVKFSGDATGDLSKLQDERRPLLQNLLADRFKMTIRRETRDIQAYVVTVANGGPKFHPAKPGDTYADGLKRPDGRPIGPGLWRPSQTELIGQGEAIKGMVWQISTELNTVVLDKTELHGDYDFTVRWAAGENKAASLPAAVREQLGLEMKLQTAPVEMLIVDHAEPVRGEAKAKN